MPNSVIICRSNEVNPDPRVEKVATTLAKHGIGVRIIGWNRSGTTRSPNKTLAGIPIDTLSIPAKFGSGIENLFNVLTWQVKLLAYLVRQRSSFQVIHACDFDTVMPAYACKVLFGKKLVYDIFDFYADHVRINSSVILNLIRFVDLGMIKRADTVIIADETRRKQISSADPGSLEVIYNTPFDIRHEKHFARTNHAKLSIAFVGVIGPDRGLEDILTLLQAHPEWHLDLAGFGSYLDTIYPLIEQLENVTWHGKVDYTEAMRLNARADVLIALYDPSVINNRFSSPNKLFEAMMLSKPIVVSNDTSMAEKVRRHNIGYCIDYGDTRHLERVLLSLQQQSHRESLGNTARRSYERFYAWEEMEKRIIRIYSKLLI